MRAKTVIGRGAPKKAGTAKVHGEPLGAEEMKATKAAYGWPDEPTFLVPADVQERYASIVAAKKKEYAAWETSFAAGRATVNSITPPPSSSTVLVTLVISTLL